MNENPKGLSDGIADGDLPLSARIALAHDGIVALDHKLATIERDQAELSGRIARGEGVGPEIRQQEAELRKLRAQTERQHLVLTSYVAKLERERSA
jgi:hypothetical protein